jgi:hypothetical protein
MTPNSSNKNQQRKRTRHQSQPTDTQMSTQELLARHSAQLRTLLREIRPPEIKTITLASPPTQATVSFSGTVVELAPIAQGTAINQRVGDAVRLESIDYRQVWYANQTQAIATTGRSILFLDTMNTGTAPVPSDVLDASAVGTAAAPFANFNIPNLHMHRFKILFDRTFSLGITGNDAFNGDLREHVKLRSRLDFSGSASSTGLRNRLYLLFISDVNANDILFTAQVNTNFTDE